jgi:dienelactone hydrolase
MRTLPLLLSIALVCAAGATAFASEARAACSVKPKLVTYYAPDALPTGKHDSRCTLDDKGKCKKLALKGYIYVPPASVKDDGPYPLLVYNHGSEEHPGLKCAEGEFFAKLGYVVVVPHRRGHGEGDDRSTGKYLTQYCADNDGPCKMKYLRMQLDDVKKAIGFAKGYKVDGKKVVDAKRIALMGHSFGGIVTMFLNQQDVGQQAAVNLSGASQSWEGSEDARNEMKIAAREALKPVYYLEPLNDHSIEPTFYLAEVAGKACRVYQTAIFPTMDSNTDGTTDMKDYKGDWDKDGKDYDPRDAAHSQFSAATELWGPTVHEFMQRYFRHPIATFTHNCQGTSVIDD